MTWTRLSDDFSDDCWKLSDGAFRLHTETLVWSNRKLLDGVIPIEELSRFARDPRQDYVEELVAAGFWKIPGQMILLRHHIDYQQTREDVIARQERNRENGRKGGRPKKREQVEDLTQNPVANPVGSSSSSATETQSLTQSQTHKDGTGRDGLLKQPRTNVYGVGECGGCGKFEPIDDDGLCRRCAEAVSA